MWGNNCNQPSLQNRKKLPQKKTQKKTKNTEERGERKIVLMKKTEEIKKGPWKAEEDEVLINHVKRYGPRDWSSIRSKSLLQRTGKSCRLRWVNKLQPNLKNGCKFSVEEERIVLELQSEFGNKWARIATYLPGRTDNDVKNFWSSRQKRLSRILHSSSSSSFKTKNIKLNQSCQGFDLVEEEITASSSSNILPYSSNQVDETCQLSEFGIKLEHQPYTFGTDLVLPETSCLFSESQISNQQPIISFSPESRELLSRLDDPFFYDILGPSSVLPQPFFEPSPPPRRFRHASIDEEPDVFLDDFPADMFDQVDPIRSP